MDADERRRAIAEAVWRLVREGGVERASVRNVAAATGLSTGSVRHVFPSQASLLGFAMELVSGRVSARVEALDLPTDPLEGATLAIGHILPLDADRRHENAVWVAFTAASLSDPSLQAIRRRAQDDLHSVARYWVARLAPRLDERASQREAHRLFALVDGLCLHAALSPEDTTPEVMREVLCHHLETLVATA